MAGGEETAFFRFDTNVDAVVADIEGGMARIQRALAEGSNLDTGQLAANTQALAPALGRAEAELEASVRRIQSLMADVGSGKITPSQFKDSFVTSIRESVRGVPTMLANEMSSVSEAVATRTNMAGVGKGIADDFVNAQVGAFRAGRPAIADAIKGLRIDPRQFNADVREVGAAPVAYGQETGRMAQLINTVRAENLAQAMTAGKIGAADITGTGFESRVDQIRKEQTAFRGKEGDGAAYIQYGDARQELRDLVRAESEAVTMGKQLTRTMEQQHAEALQLNAALDLLAGGYTKVGGLRVNALGQAYKTAGAGAAAETNPLKVAEASDAMAKIGTETANAEHLMRNWASVIPVGQYAVLGDEVYRVNKGLAQQVQHGLEYQTVMDRVAAKTAQQGRAQARQSGGDQGLLGGFFNKIGGRSGADSLMNNLGSHIASAASFTVGYGALFAVQGAIRDTISEYSDYQDSLTDLQVATRDSSVVTQSWVNDLSDLARVTGENVGAAMDTAARGVRAFASPVSSTAQELREIGTAANDAANKLALISETSLSDATGNLVAIATSYGKQPDQLDQIVDAIANAKRSTGGDPKQISQGLASIASSATVAGFDVNQAADLVSLVQARTDQSGLSAATRLTRIFQTTSGTTGKGLGRELGVDTDQSVKDQLLDYAKIYNQEGTSKAVKDRITSSLGGTANLRELLAILENSDTLMQAFGESARNAGQGTDEFNRKSDNLTGTLTKIKGDIRAIQTDLGRTDIGAPFAAAVYTIEPLLHLLDRMLQIFDELPGAIKLSLGLVADVAIASKAIAVVSNARNAARDRASAISGTGARDAESAAIVTATERRMAAENAFTASLGEAAAARATAEGREDAVIVEATAARAAAEGVGTGADLAGDLAGGRKKMGIRGGLASLLGFGTNPYVLGAGALIGGGVLANKVFDANDQNNKYNEIASGTSSAYGRVDGTAMSLEQAATDLRAAAGRVSQSDTNFLSKGNRTAVAAGLEDQAKEIAALQRSVQAEQNRNAAAGSNSVFGEGGVVTTVAQLSEGLNSLAGSGKTALQQMRALEEALDDTAAPREGQRFQPAAVGANTAAQTMEALKNALPKELRFFADKSLPGDDYDPSRPRDAVGTQRTTISRSQGAAYELLQNQNNLADIDKAVQAKAKQLGLKAGDLLTPETKDILAQAAVDALDLKNVADDQGDIRKRLFTILKKNLASDAKEKSQQLLNGTGRLSPGDVQSLLEPSEDGTYKGLAANQQAAEAAIGPGDDGSKLVRSRRQYLRTLTSLKGRLGGDNLPILNLSIAQAEDAFAESAINRLETLRRAAQNRPGLGKKAVRDIGRGFLQREINAAGTNTKRMIDIMANADAASLDIVRAHLKQLADIAAASGMTPANPTIAVDPRGPTKAERVLTAFDKARKQSNVSNDPYGGIFATGSDAANYDPDKYKDDESKLTAAQRAALKAQALTNPNNTVATATAALRVARANHAAAEKGSQEYYSTLGEVTSAQNSLAQAVSERSGAIAQANAARVGGQLANARASIVSARASLAASTRGTTGYFQALASFYTAQQSMRDAMVQYRNNLDSLRGDSTNPVEQARDALRAARRKLAFDRGQGKDVRAEDRVAAQEARNSLMGAKFDQRFSDMQTADELGRISHQKYLSYLDHEHDRLAAIKHRTRQQQDQLNEVDSAMKAAASAMDGQFNLGDINTNGLVYQMRRFKAEASAQATSAQIANSSQVNQTVTVSINGADTAKVRSILDTYLNIGGGQRRTVARRKV